MASIRAAIDTMQAHVSGTVTVQLYKGNVGLLGRTSALSLFKDNLATYGTKDAFNHQASEGFIEIWSLPTETANAVRQGQLPGRGTQKTLEASFKPKAKANGAAKPKGKVAVKAK